MANLFFYSEFNVRMPIIYWVSLGWVLCSFCTGTEYYYICKNLDEIIKNQK